MLALLAGCGPPADPELVSRRDALARWEEGRALLDAGDPAAARAAFAAARALRDDPLLAGWEAVALARGGDLAGASALAEQTLAREPRLTELRYDFAGWLVRLDRPEEAARELSRVIADGGVRALDVLEDPDFEASLDHPAFGFLPRDALALAVDPVPPTAFWGTEVPVVLHLTGLVSAPIAVSAGRADGPARLLSAIEQRTGDGLDWTFTLSVTGAGEVVVGPFVATAGRHRAEAPEVRVVTDAPPDRSSAPEPLEIVAPSAWLDRVPARSVRVVDGRLVVRADGRDRVETEPALAPPVRYELRGVDGTVEVVRVWPAGATARRVRLLATDGATLHDGPP